MKDKEMEGMEGMEEMEEKKRKRYGKKRCSFGKRVCVCCFDKSNHSIIHSINPQNSTQFNHNPIPQFFINTHTPPSLISIDPSLKSTRTHVSILNQIPPTSIIPLLHHSNQSLPQFSLLSLSVFDVIE